MLTDGRTEGRTKSDHNSSSWAELRWAKNKHNSGMLGPMEKKQQKHVLRTSQPNEVMSSAVSLPNHTITGL